MTRIILCIVSLALLTMCGDRRSRLTVESSSQSYLDAIPKSPAAPMLASFKEGQSSIIGIERKLIKNGDLSFETDDVRKTKSKVESICKELNAYISNENQNNYGERLQYNQTIRVPANQFDSLTLLIEADAVKVESKNINTQDVTEEFIDVEARLKTKKELEARYREILKQAKTVPDIVSIESQIANVRSEIESMEGRLNYLKSQVAYSTLNVSYYELIGTDFGFASKLVRGIAEGWDNLLSFIVLLVNIWPFVIIAASGTWIFIRWRRRKKIKFPA